MRGYQLIRPPQRLHRAKLDNLALVPGNLLPYKEQWQAIANNLPQGTVLIIFPASNSPQRRTLETVANLLQADGRRVSTLSSKDFF